ncbi:hypothetical protein SUDANB151_00871 [Streptomyces sp. enrichment culture]
MPTRAARYPQAALISGLILSTKNMEHMENPENRVRI